MFKLISFYNRNSNEPFVINNFVGDFKNIINCDRFIEDNKYTVSKYKVDNSPTFIVTDELESQTFFRTTSVNDIRLYIQELGNVEGNIKDIL